MRRFSKLAIGTIGLMGAWALPAAADSLGVQFTGTPTATLNSAPAGIAYGYNLSIGYKHLHNRHRPGGIR